jgi:hypothetical protein
MTLAKTLELTGLAFDLFGLALLMSPDIPWLRFLLSLLSTVRILDEEVSSIQTQCEAAGYSLDRKTRWSPGQHLLKDISLVKAKPLLALYPNTYRPPNPPRGDFTPFIADAVLVREQGQGVILDDPFVGIGDDFGGSTRVMLLSSLLEKKDDAIRRIAYGHGFALMALASMLLMMSVFTR